jgi:hypothetical protein
MLAGTACIYQLQRADPKVIEAKLKRRIHELTYRNNPKLDEAYNRKAKPLSPRVGKLLSNIGVQDVVR